MRVAVGICLWCLMGCGPDPRPYELPKTEIFEPVHSECVEVQGLDLRLCRIPPGWVETGGEYSLNAVRRYDIGELWLSDTPVTNADYESFRPEHERAPFSPEDRSPVTDVSWYEAEAFAAWFEERCGVETRLPTSLEWHYACLGGTQGPLPWGAKRAWLAEQQREKANLWSTEAVPVRQYAPNGFGLYDMVGNVREWGGDWWVLDSPNYPGEVLLPGEPGYEEHRVDLKTVKNCSANNSGLRFCECYYTSGGDPDNPHPWRSFRIATERRPEGRCIASQ